MIQCDFRSTIIVFFFFVCYNIIIYSQQMVLNVQQVLHVILYLVT